MTQVLGQRSGFFRGKGYGVKPPSKRVSDRITPQEIQEQKRKLREEVVAEVREEMRVREERLQAQFEEKLQSQMASLIASLQQVFLDKICLVQLHYVILTTNCKSNMLIN